jgi:hypothetical protein
MEHEEPLQRVDPPKVTEPTSGPDHDAHRERLQRLSDKADRMLDAIEAGNAEQFLQQHRQRGAQ